MTNFLRRLLLIVATALTLGSLGLPVVAQEVAPEQLALARRYIDLTDRANLYETSLVNAGVQTMRTVLAQNPEIAEPLQQAIIRTLETYRDRKGELLDQFARLYATRFTLEELQQIVTFYESPVGMKLTEANTGLNTDVQRVMSIWEANLSTEFFAKVRAELKAAGFTI